MSVNSLFLSVHNIDAFACNAVQFASVEAVYSFAAVDVCGYGVDVCGLTLKRHAYRLCVYVAAIACSTLADLARRNSLVRPLMMSPVVLIITTRTPLAVLCVTS